MDRVGVAGPGGAAVHRRRVGGEVGEDAEAGVAEEGFGGEVEAEETDAGDGEGEGDEGASGAGGSGFALDGGPGVAEAGEAHQRGEEISVPGFGGDVAHLEAKGADEGGEENGGFGDEGGEGRGGIEPVGQEAPARPAMEEGIVRADTEEGREEAVPGDQAMGAVEDVGGERDGVEFAPADLARPGDLLGGWERGGDGVAEAFEDIAAFGVVDGEGGEDALQRCPAGLGDAAGFDPLEVAGAEAGFGFDPELGLAGLFAEGAEAGAAGGGHDEFRGASFELRVTNSTSKTMTGRDWVGRVAERREA
jgi:hypothetical protein